MTAKELAFEVGVHHVTAYRIIRALKDQKLLHICGWDKDSLGRVNVPIYKFGTGRDVKRVRKTAAERQAQCRARKANIDLVNIFARKPEVVG